MKLIFENDWGWNRYFDTFQKMKIAEKNNRSSLTFLTQFDTFEWWKYPEHSKHKKASGEGDHDSDGDEKKGQNYFTIGKQRSDD